MLFCAVLHISVNGLIQKLLLFFRVFLMSIHYLYCKRGGCDKIRTYNLSRRKAALYPFELHSQALASVALWLVAQLGFEPRFPESGSDVLPLDDWAEI
tara:strand:+ start:812 stop:1105 length:294 start_codon:yes stop_codon:yes gene_type:complete